MLGGIYAVLAPWLRASFQRALLAGDPHDQGGPAAHRHLGPGPGRGRPGAAGLVSASLLARPGALLPGSARGGSIETMPKLVLGPLLRYVGRPRPPSGWRLDAAARVEVETVAGRAGPGGRRGRARPRRRPSGSMATTTRWS